MHSVECHFVIFVLQVWHGLPLLALTFLIIWRCCAVASWHSRCFFDVFLACVTFLLSACCDLGFFIVRNSPNHVAKEAVLDRVLACFANVLGLASLRAVL